MTFSRGRSEDRGSRLLLNSMSAPVPFAHQFLGLMPLPMNRAANRLGGEEAAAPEVDSLPSSGIASSHGMAIVTPTPLSNARRLILFACEFIISIPRTRGHWERAFTSFIVLHLARFRVRVEGRIVASHPPTPVATTVVSLQRLQRLRLTPFPLTTETLQQDGLRVTE